MLSTNKNIETIGQLVEVLKHYIGLQTKYAKLDVIDKVVRLLTAFAMAVVLCVLLTFVLIFLSVAGACALASLIGYGAAFCVVALVYLVVFVLCIILRKRLIERPLVKLIAGILLQE